MHDVMNVLFIHPNNKYTGQEISLLERIIGLKHNGVNCAVVLPEQGKFGRILGEYDIPVVIADLSRFDRSNKRAFVRSIWTMRRIIKQQQASIVHCSGIYSNQYAVWAAKLSGIPCVASISTTVYNDYDFRSNFTHALNRVCCVSEAVRQNLLEKSRVTEQQAVTLYDGYHLDSIKVDPDAVARFRTDFDIQDHHRIIATIGEVIPRKGIEYFVEMAHILKKQHDHLKFLVIGEHHNDEYEQQVRQQIQKLNLSDDVIFTGFQPDIYSIISQLDVSVVASLAEGLCRVIVETQQMEKPIVSTAVSGNVEAIRDGYNGYLVESQRPDLLAERVSHILKHPDEARTLGQNAKASVQEKFTLQAHVDHLLRIYRDISKGDSPQKGTGR